MKKCYLNCNKDTVDDEVIFKHLKELSKGEINLIDRDEALREVKDFVRKRKPTGKSSGKSKNDQRKRNYKSN